MLVEYQKIIKRVMNKACFFGVCVEKGPDDDIFCHVKIEKQKWDTKLKKGCGLCVKIVSLLQKYNVSVSGGGLPYVWWSHTECV